VASTTQQHQDRHEREEDSQLLNISVVFTIGREQVQKVPRYLFFRHR
jgi:hypothetical protein